MQGTVQRRVGGDILAQGAYLSRACKVLQFVHGSFVQMMRHGVAHRPAGSSRFWRAMSEDYRGFVTNSMFDVGAKTFPKCSSSFSKMNELAPKFPDSRGWYRPAGGQRAYLGTAASLPSQTMNHATELKASSPPRRPLHFPFLRALAAVALARSTFSAVRTTSSNDVIAHHCCVMAFAPSSISPTIRRPLDTSDHHVCIATELYLAASPPPGRRGREMEIRRKVSENIITRERAHNYSAWSSSHPPATHFLFLHR